MSTLSFELLWKLYIYKKNNFRCSNFISEVSERCKIVFWHY